jgi:uncharacterized protein (TIGR02145 family)/prepilin-type N-terminal cleavage/methylation domain-containing protein
MIKLGQNLAYMNNKKHHKILHPKQASKLEQKTKAPKIKKKKKKITLSFTLIELIVVIAIIALLATMALIGIGNARIKSRDVKRIADIKQINSALALYYNDKNQYPMAIISGQALYSTSLDVNGNISTTTYLGSVPTAPANFDGANCSSANNAYIYNSSSDLQSYTLSTCVASNKDGSAIYISDSTQNQPCGSYIINYGGQTYRTVQIGTQCWMKDNLNVGTMILGASDQNNNGLIEKYCYDDLAINCETYGGLYTWDEAMQYSDLEKSQGICPPGWHIPADLEQNTLDQYLKNSGQSCDATRNGPWDCSAAGTKLKAGGSSGFEALMAGSRLTNKSFGGQDTETFFWSSSNLGQDGRSRSLNAGRSTVYRHPYPKDRGFSLRCLKN